jgi:restriction endonuclease S subunit
MAVKNLGEVADIISGITDDRESAGKYVYRLIQPNGLNDSGDLVQLTGIFRQEPISDWQLVKSGDVLIKRLNPSSAFLMEDVNMPTAITQNIFIIRATEAILPSYLAFLMDQARVLSQAEHLSGTVATIKAVSAKKLMEIPIPIVPLSRQSVLGELWKLTKQRKRLLMHYMDESDKIMASISDVFLKSMEGQQ